jgi:hypothetical protein
MIIFYCLRFENHPTWRTGSPYLYPPGTGWPSYTPGTGFPFRSLLRHSGLRWRYSNPPPHGMSPIRLLSFRYILSIWYDTDRIYNIATNSSIVACVFVAAGKRLSSHCLATISGGTQTLRQQGDLINLILLFLNVGSNVKITTEAKF